MICQLGALKSVELLILRFLDLELLLNVLVFNNSQLNHARPFFLHLLDAIIESLSIVQVNLEQVVPLKSYDLVATKEYYLSKVIMKAHHFERSILLH